MKSVTEVLEVRDHWNFKVTKLNLGSSKFVKPEGAAYVLLNNGSVKFENMSLSSVNACLVTSETFTVHGNACLIEIAGYSYHQTRVYHQERLVTGSLSYMDGGTNDTAIPPNRIGGPVINYVHFPAGMYQTLHTHPSQRVGMVLSGKGKIELNHHKFHYINEGEVFYMNRNELHNFICEDDDVTLFVWAPDSGSGPTDEVNPLKARTYLGQERPNSML